MTDLDLTPSGPRRPVRTGVRSWRNWVISIALVAVGGFVLYQALTTATVYFLNVDEALAQRDELGDDTFNLQGTVTSAPVTEADGSMVFTVSFGGASTTVRHVGDEPSGLFKKGERVVAKGRWAGSFFRSDQVLVKHTEEYVEDNPDRLDYELDGTESEIGAGPVVDADRARYSDGGAGSAA